MLSLRLIHPSGPPTTTGLLVCGKDPRAFLPGAYVQFVRYPGCTIGDSVVDHQEIGGMLSDQMRRLDEVIALNIAHRAAERRSKTIQPIPSLHCRNSCATR